MPSAAWPAFFVTVVVITAGRIGVINIDPTWVLIGLAGLLLGYGLLRGATRPMEGLPLQAIAMLAFGAAAALALYLNEVFGAYLVAAGLLAHAAWDLYHHWANKVVVRSMAEFCFVLDTILAVAIVVATLRL
jgi:Na+/phosphate symporter